MSTVTESIFLPTGTEANRWDRITLIETRSHSFASTPGWRPALNAYRCADEFVVFVDLAGVPPDSIECLASEHRLIVRGTRPPPEPECSRAELAQLLAWEIDHGTFERVLDLPQAIDPARVTSHQSDGILHIHLPLAD